MLRAFKPSTPLDRNAVRRVTRTRSYVGTRMFTACVHVWCIVIIYATHTRDGGKAKRDVQKDNVVESLLLPCSVNA